MRHTGVLKSGEISEDSIHKAVMQWVGLKPSIERLILHIPNEGFRTKRYGKKLKDMGMKAGVSDLFIAMPSHGFHGAWIELKSKNGILSALQKEFLEDMRIQGYFTSVCYSIDEAINMIDWYCFHAQKELFSCA